MLDSKACIKLNYKKGITTVYKWRIDHAKIKTIAIEKYLAQALVQKC